MQNIAYLLHTSRFRRRISRVPLGGQKRRSLQRQFHAIDVSRGSQASLSRFVLERAKSRGQAQNKGYWHGICGIHATDPETSRERARIRRESSHYRAHFPWSDYNCARARPSYRLFSSLLGSLLLFRLFCSRFHCPSRRKTATAPR